MPIEHYCHVGDCEVEVPPRRLMCMMHWQKVPKRLQQDVWRYYRPGQEIDKNPSSEYLRVARAAINAVAEKEGKQSLQARMF